MKRPLGILTLISAAAMFSLSCACWWGCGADEYAPSSAKQGARAEEQVDLSFNDLTEDVTSRIQMVSSVRYDENSNQVDILASIKDQDGNSFVAVRQLNRHNFIVALNSSVLPRAVETEEPVFELSNDNFVAIVVDTSGSMSASSNPDDLTSPTRLDVAKQAAKLFVSLMSTGDQTAIVRFDTGASIVQPMTDNAADLEAAIDSLDLAGATNIGDAISEGVRAVGAQPGKRAIVLLTDGDDTVDTILGGPDVWMNNNSSVRWKALSQAIDNELIVYTVGLGNGLSETGIADLETIAAETGGSFFPAPTVSALLDAFGNIIPGELSALPPIEVLVLSFENPLRAPLGKSLMVPLNLILTYQNKLNLHKVKTSGSYTF